MKRNRLAILLIFAAALSIDGCGGTAERSDRNGNVANTSPSVGAAAPTPATIDEASPAGTPAVASETEATRPGAAPSTTRGGGNVQPAKMPAPHVGSGGNDLFLFTQARAAINNDADLKTANVVIDVKEGVVTLSGTVLSPTLKSKAEQLARGVGPKEVRNQLKVAAGR